MPERIVGHIKLRIGSLYLSVRYDYCERGRAADFPEIYRQIARRSHQIFEKLYSLSAGLVMGRILRQAPSVAKDNRGIERCSLRLSECMGAGDLS